MRKMRKLMTMFILTAFLLIGINSNNYVHADTDITSNCGILMEQTTGRVLFDKCSDVQMYIASITKILTAIVAIENADLDEWVEVTYEDIHQVGSSLYMTLGDRMSLKDLLYGLMMRSGNDAAWAIARHVGGDVDSFVAMMNDKAAEIGMTNSTFQNPSGLDETTYNLSTAYDMALVQRYAMNNPIYRAISSESMHRAVSEGGQVFTWKNKHRLVNGGYQYAISGKTGFTKRAKRTLVTSANNEELEFVVVTIKGADDWHDHIHLFKYGFKNFNMRQVTDIGELHVLERELLEQAGFNRLFIREERSVVLRNDSSETVRKHLVLTTDETDETVGTLEILINDQVVDTLPVYVFEEISSGSWWQQVLDWFVGFWV